MKKIVSIMIALFFVLGVLTVTAFASSYTNTGVDFTKKYEHKYDNGAYYAFYYPNESNGCYLSTDISVSNDMTVVVSVAATGHDGCPYYSGLKITNGNYISAEIEPTTVYVRDSQHTGTRRINGVTIDTFSASYS